MKIFKYLISISWLLFQTSLCFATSEDVINFSFLPDPISHCQQYEIDVAITEKSTLGAIGATECNSDRATFGNPNSAVTSKFHRLMLPWKYSPHGAFRDGYFWMATVGAESSEFKTAAGSTCKC